MEWVRELTFAQRKERPLVLPDHMTWVHRSEPRKQLLPGSWVVSRAYWLSGLASANQYPASGA
jgi:hypothetical protein